MKKLSRRFFFGIILFFNFTILYWFCCVADSWSFSFIINIESWILAYVEVKTLDDVIYSQGHTKSIL